MQYDEWGEVAGIPLVPNAPEGNWHVPIMIPLTEHFHMLEAVCKHCGRIPDRSAIEATAAWMEDVREALGGRAIHVNSWARCPIHNAAVGGAPNSFHMKGMALDITVKGLTPAQVHAACSKLQGKGKLIGGLGKYSSWVHVDRGPARRWNGP